MVLAPIEPVAPSSETERTESGAACIGADTDGVTGSPYQQAARRMRDTVVRDPDDQRGRKRRDETVQPIHQTAMTGNDVARVLGAEVALDGGLQKIARLRHDRK